MAVNKVVYGTTVLVDMTDATASADQILEGYTAYGADGTKLVGTASGETLVISDTVDEHGGTIREITSKKVVKLQTKEITPTTQKQTVNPDTGYDGFSTVTVNAAEGEKINNQNKSVTPTESQQTVTADSGYTGLGTVTVGAVSSTYVGSGIPKNPTVTVEGPTVKIPQGYYSEKVDKSVALGSAATPATSITANPTVSINSSGLVTATANASKSITPSVTAGYISEGTAGNVTASGSGTLQLTTQAAKTVTPTKSSQQAVASGVYTIGAVTVGAIPEEYITTTDATASSSDILTGKTAYANGSKVTGSLVINKYYTGTTAPSASLGSDGDIYLQS